MFGKMIGYISCQVNFHKAALSLGQSHQMWSQKSPGCVTILACRMLLTLRSTKKLLAFLTLATCIFNLWLMGGVSRNFK